MATGFAVNTVGSVGERRGYLLRQKSDRDHVLFHRRSLRRSIRDDASKLNQFQYSASALQESVQEIISGKIDSSHSSFSTFSYDPALDVEDQKLPSKHQKATRYDEEKQKQLDRVYKKESTNEVIDDLEDVKLPMEGSGESMMEVAPGISVPLRGSHETWEAIKDGRVTVTTCCACQLELHCIEDAEMVICPDCWIVSPVDQMVGGIPLEEEDSDYNAGQKKSSSHGVGLGVKPTDVVEWLEAGY